MSDLEKMLTDTVKDFKKAEERYIEPVERAKKTAEEIASLAKLQKEQAEK